MYNLGISAEEARILSELCLIEGDIRAAAELRGIKEVTVEVPTEIAETLQNAIFKKKFSVVIHTSLKEDKINEETFLKINW